jgi:hypothetical protein
MDHYTVALLGHMAWQTRSDVSNDTGRFMPADEAAGERTVRVVRRAIRVQIAAAHTRGLHLDNDLAGAWCRFADFNECQTTIA